MRKTSLQSRDHDWVERAIELADDCPDLLKFEIDT